MGQTTATSVENTTAAPTQVKDREERNEEEKKRRSRKEEKEEDDKVKSKLQVALIQYLEDYH